MSIMKTMKFLFVLILSSLLIGSCAPEDLVEQEEILITANSTTALEAVIIGNRNRIKQKPRRNYKSTIVVDDPTNSVTTAIVQYTPLEGENPFPEPFEMGVSTIRKSIRKMQKIQAMNSDNDPFPAGKPFQQTATLYNENGEQVGNNSETWVTAQDNDGTDVDRVEAVYRSPTSVTVPLRLNSKNRDNIGEVFARVELYGRILIKGEPIEFEMTVPDDNDNGTTLEGSITAELGELIDGGDILPGDELMISITTKNTSSELIDEDFFIIPVIAANVSDQVRNTNTYVFGQTFYVETRVAVDAGVGLINTVVRPLAGQEFEPFEMVLNPVRETENVIIFRSEAFTNPTFVGAADAQQNVLHTMTLYEEDGTIIEDTAAPSPISILEGITRNPKHIIRPNNNTRIRMRLQDAIGSQVSYATMTIPADVVEGGGEEVALEVVQSTIDDKIYRIDEDFVYTYVAPTPDGTTYTTEVTTYDLQGNVIGSEVVTFTIDDKRPSAFTYTNAQIVNRPGGVIRIKGYVEPRPTSGAPINSGGPANNRVVIPNGNEDGTALELLLPLQPDPVNPNLFFYDEIIESINVVFENTLTAESTILDSEGQEIGSETVTFEVVDPITFIEVALHQNKNLDTYTFLVDVTGADLDTLEQIIVYLSPQDGGSDADPEDFILEFEQETFDGRLYANTNVSFADPENVIDMLYEAAITITTSYGTLPDYDYDELARRHEEREYPYPEDE